MARKRSLLEKMKANPAGDWTIANVETLCKQVGLTILKPSGGSHYLVMSKFVQGAQSVPARRPIKPIYIKALVGLCEEHMTISNQTKEGD